MRRMRFVANAVENQHVQALKPGNRFLGNKIQVGRVGKIVEAISNHGQLAVNDFERRYFQIFADTERRIMLDRVRNQLGKPAADMRRLKDILKNAFEVFPRDFVGVNAHRAVAKIERANIVEPENMVNMTMRDQNRVEIINARAQRLLAKIYRGINENFPSGVLDKYRNAQAFIARIVRKTSFAIASD